MLLALRLPLIEKLTKGLDKSYYLHKWLGIYGITFGIFHWLLAIVPKELVQLGILEKPVKPKNKTRKAMMNYQRAVCEYVKNKNKWK